MSGVLLVGLCQGLTLLVIDSNVCNEANPVLDAYDFALTSDDCQWEAGIRMSITALVVWVVIGMLLLFGVIPPPQGYPRAPQQTQTVTYQQTIHPDGSRTVEQVRVVKGTVPSKV